jgi:hypothetical protein
MRLKTLATALATLFATPAFAQQPYVNPQGAAISQDQAAANAAQAHHASNVARHDAAVGNYAGARQASRVAHRAAHRARVDEHRAVAQDPAIAGH